MVHQKVPQILWVDRGTKYIGMAYAHPTTNIVFPIGYLMNDPGLFFSIGDVLERYHIGTVVIGYPKQHKEFQTQIDAFLENILFINEDINVVKVDEEYSSVQAQAKTDDYKKTSHEDTLAAMVILENYLQTTQKKK